MFAPRLLLAVLLALFPLSELRAAKAPIDLDGVTFVCEGREKLTVKRLGSLFDGVLSRISFSATQWQSLDEEGLQLGGTWQVSGGRFLLVYDSQALLDLEAAIASWIEEEVDFDVTVTGLTISTIATAKVGRDGTKTVKYKTAATFSASGGGYFVTGKLSERGTGVEIP